MMPINNPLLSIIQTARSGGNPMPLIQQAVSRHPKGAQIMPMIQGKNGNQMRSTAFNMAKEYGVDLNRFAQQFGLNLPK